MKDKYGKIITIGTKVAFNWCGQVCIGTVVAIKARKQYGETHNERNEPFTNFDIQHINHKGTSRVKDIDSLASLE